MKFRGIAAALLASAGALSCSTASAQQVPPYTVPLGRAGGGAGFSYATPGTAGYPLTSQGMSAYPSFGAISSSALSFTQSGTGAQPVTFDAIFRATWVTPEMFKSTATCDGTDDGPAIQRAVTYAGSLGSKGEVRPGNCSYKIITPVVDPNGIHMRCQSMFGPQFVFAPSSNNQIAYRVRNAGNLVSGGGIHNCGFYTFDTTNTKTAIEIEDVSNYTIEGVTVRGSTVSGGGSYWGGGGNSIGISIKGREHIRVKGIASNAERPFVIDGNPNSTIDNDWGDYRSLSLVTYGNLKNFEINDGVNFTHMSIDGVSCVQGAYCIYNNDTTAAQISQGLAIKNVGSEQSTASVAANSATIWIKRPAGGLLYGLTIEGSNVFDGARNAVVLRNVVDPKISGVQFESSASYNCFDTTNTVVGLSWVGSIWRGCSTGGLSGQLLVDSDQTQTGYAFPRRANYVADTEDNTKVVRSVGVLGTTSNISFLRAQASPAGNIVLLPSSSGTLVATASAPLLINSTTGNLTITGAAGQVLAGSTPAFTATPVLGVAGSTVGTLGFQNATSGTITLSPPAGALGTVTVSLPAATDTLVGKATTDTLTNKTVNLTSNTLTGTTAQFNTALSDGDFATLAGTEELTNKTLNASVLKGTLTASGTVTLPAFTLAGAITGGGNQINNAPIGAGVASTGSFTTLTAATSFSLTNNQDGNTVIASNNNSSGTGASAYLETNNGTNLIRFGMRGLNQTAYGALAANTAFFYSAADVNLMSDGGKMVVATGGSAEKFRFAASGCFGAGTTTDCGAGGILANTSLESTTYTKVGTKIRAGGTAPALTSCGTSPAISGSDLAGEVTMGTGSPTGCVITFNAAYSSAPYCVVTWQATPLASQSYAVSTTAITLTQTATSSNKVNYVCMARSGG